MFVRSPADPPTRLSPAVRHLELLYRPPRPPHPAPKRGEGGGTVSGWRSRGVEQQEEVCCSFLICRNFLRSFHLDRQSGSNEERATRRARAQLTRTDHRSIVVIGDGSGTDRGLADQGGWRVGGARTGPRPACCRFSSFRCWCCCSGAAEPMKVRPRRVLMVPPPPKKKGTRTLIDELVDPDV